MDCGGNIGTKPNINTRYEHQVENMVHFRLNIRCRALLDFIRVTYIKLRKLKTNQHSATIRQRLSGLSAFAEVFVIRHPGCLPVTGYIITSRIVGHLMIPVRLAGLVANNVLVFPSCQHELTPMSPEFDWLTQYRRFDWQRHLLSAPSTSIGKHSYKSTYRCR